VVERALLKIGRMCTSDCIFCHADGPNNSVILPLREVCRRILAVRKAGFQGVVLSGGEPTAHPEFLKIARFVKRSGLSLGVVTNGRALADEDLASSLLECDLDYVNVSLHGPDAATHDNLSGVESFEQARRTIDNFAYIDHLLLSVTTVVARPNLSTLIQTVTLVTGLMSFPWSEERHAHRLALVEPKGRAARDPSILPDPSVAARAMGEALEHGAAIHGHGPSRGVDGLPLCLQPRAHGSAQDLRAHGIAVMQEPEEIRLYPVDHGRRSFAEACLSCVEKERCPGMFSGYLPDYEDALAAFDRHQEP
jgi:organic radical activating enzyme